MNRLAKKPKDGKVFPGRQPSSVLLYILILFIVLYGFIEKRIAKVNADPSVLFNGQLKYIGESKINLLNNVISYSNNYPFTVSGLDGTIKKGCFLDSKSIFLLTTSGKLYTRYDGDDSYYDHPLGNAFRKRSGFQLVNTGALSGETIRDLDCGSSHVLVVTQSNTVVGFGNNQNYQIGDGTNFERTTPVNAVLPVGLSDTITKIVAAQQHSCFLTNVGNLYCWGRNDYGQIGIGDILPTYVTTPELISMPGTDTLSDVIIGMKISFGISQDRKKLYSWGKTYGLGRYDGCNPSNFDPVPDSTFVESRAGITITSFVYSSNDIGVLLLSDNSIYVFGAYGTISSLTPCHSTPTSLSISNLPASLRFVNVIGTVVITGDQDIYGWGKIGGSYTTASSKFNNAINSNSVTVSLKSLTEPFHSWFSFTYFVGDDNNLYTLGLTSDFYSSGYIDSGFTFRFLDISVSDIDNIAVVTTTGQLGVWGVNTPTSISGSSVNTATFLSTLTYPSTTNKFYKVSLSRSGEFVVGLDVTNRLYGYGKNYGQLSSNPPFVPELVSIDVNGKDIMDVATGGYFMIVLTRDYLVYSIGKNDRGQLGDGTLNDRISFYNIPFVTSVKLIRCSFKTGFALDSLGNLYAWGDNSKRLVKSSSTTYFATPQSISTSFCSGSIENIYTGYENVFYLCSNGKLYCAGANNRGQCGVGLSSSTISTPTEMIFPEVIQVKYLYSSKLATLVVSKANKIYGIGDTSYGAHFGGSASIDGSTDSRSPTLITLGNGWDSSLSTYSVYKVAVGSGAASMIAFQPPISCFSKTSIELDVCSSHGSCMFNDVCSCNLGYAGTNCETGPYCFGVLYNQTSVCNGRGNCLGGDICSCFTGASGIRCEYYTCYSVSSLSSSEISVNIQYATVSPQMKQVFVVD
ncbi:hypothetical protein ABK040_016081 [Willaertia magna]